jgi:hypothetical protein
MSDIENGSRFICVPPGITMVRPAIPEREAISKPASKPILASWGTFPPDAFGVHHSLQAQKRAIGRLDQEQPARSSWETDRDQSTHS